MLPVRYRAATLAGEKHQIDIQVGKCPLHRYNRLASRTYGRYMARDTHVTQALHLPFLRFPRSAGIHVYGETPNTVGEDARVPQDPDS
jgi:hypothetical protein